MKVFVYADVCGVRTTESNFTCCMLSNYVNWQIYFHAVFNKALLFSNQSIKTLCLTA